MTFRRILRIACALVLAATGGCGGAPVHEAHVDARHAEGPEPPLDRISTGGELLALPFAPFDELTPPERQIIADQLHKRSGLEVHILPNMFEVCGATDAAAVKSKLSGLFQRATDLTVEEGCRAMVGLSRFGERNRLRSEFVRDDSVDVGRIWMAVIDAFQKTCGAEIDSRTRKVERDGLVRSFETHERRVPTSAGFSGIVVKERLFVKLEESGDRANGHPSDDFFLIVESTLYWRRQSASEWNVVKSAQSLDPKILRGLPSSPLDTCCRGLVSAISQ